MRALVRRPVVVALALAVVASGLALFLTAADPSYGLFSHVFSNGSNTFSTDTLDPPTGLAAAPGPGAPKIKLNWTVTVDSYASGYRVFRSTTSGGPYTQIKELTPATEIKYTDNTVTTGTTYYYVLRSFYQNWESVNSNEASALAP